jgi:ACS family tartrate transporter-like MFS transporter
MTGVSGWRSRCPGIGSQATANGSLALWQPQFIKSFGMSNLQIGLQNALPFIVAAISMYYGGLHSDRRDERVLHTAIPTSATTLALSLCLVVTSLPGTLLLLCLALFGISASRGPFWALSTGWLSARNAAAGIAQINAIGTGCTFFTNYITGAIKDATGSWPLSLLPIAGLTAAATIIVVALGDPRRDQR